MFFADDVHRFANLRHWKSDTKFLLLCKHEKFFRYSKIGKCRAAFFFGFLRLVPDNNDDEFRENSGKREMKLKTLRNVIEF